MVEKLFSNNCFSLTRGFQHTRASLQRETQSRRDNDVYKAANRRFCGSLLGMAHHAPMPNSVAALWERNSRGRVSAHDLFVWLRPGGGVPLTSFNSTLSAGGA